jgi:hypothetical protein
VATIVKLKSGNFRVQVRRKGQYASKTFLRKSDADDWAVQAARDIDNGKTPSPRVRATAKNSFGSLIDMHLDDLADTGKPLRRSKEAVLRRLKEDLGDLAIGETLTRWRGMRTHS